jgi:hypothetical protein
MKKVVILASAAMISVALLSGSAAAQGTTDKIEGTGKELKGSVKETIGKATGDTKLELEGKAVNGNARGGGAGRLLGGGSRSGGLDDDGTRDGDAVGRGGDANRTLRRSRILDNSPYPRGAGPGREGYWLGACGGGGEAGPSVTVWVMK